MADFLTPFLLSLCARASTTFEGVGLIEGFDPLWENLITGFSLAFTAGMMVYITTDQIIPTAHLQCTKKHTMGIGILLGMMFILFLTAIIPPTMVV